MLAFFRALNDIVDLVYKGSTTEASKTRRTGPCIQSGSAVDDTVICSLLGGLTWFIPHKV